MYVFFLYLIALLAAFACDVTLIPNSRMNSPPVSGGALQNWTSQNAALRICSPTKMNQGGVLGIAKSPTSAPLALLISQIVAIIPSRTYVFSCDVYDYDESDLSVLVDGVQASSLTTNSRGSFATISQSFVANGTMARVQIGVRGRGACFKNCEFVEPCPETSSSPTSRSPTPSNSQDPGTPTPVSPTSVIAPTSPTPYAGDADGRTFSPTTRSPTSAPTNLISPGLSLIRSLQRAITANVTAHPYLGLVIRCIASTFPFTTDSSFWNATEAKHTVVIVQKAFGGVFQFDELLSNTSYSITCGSQTAQQSPIVNVTAMTLVSCANNPGCPGTSQCIDAVDGTSYVCMPFIDGISRGVALAPCRSKDGSLNSTRVDLNTTAGGERINLCLGIGPDVDASALVSTLQIIYGLSLSAPEFICTNLNFSEPINSTIRVSCLSAPGVGSNLTVGLRLHLSNVTTTLMSPVDRIGYPSPIIIRDTLRLLDFPNITNFTLGQVQSPVITSVNVSFEVKNVFLDTPLLKIYYGIDDSPEQYQCTLDRQRSTATTIVCSTFPFTQYFIIPFQFQVTAGDVSIRGYDTFQLSTKVPVIVRLASTACQADGEGLSECPTEGSTTSNPVILTIYGFNFGVSSNILIRTYVDGLNCPMRDAVAGTNATDPDRLECELPSSTGFNRAVFMQSNNLFSTSVSILSYRAPVITGLCGCASNCSHLTLSVEGCQRRGNDILHVFGTSFGGANAVILVGAALCTNVTHDATTPQTHLTCVLPRGFSTETLILSQRSGPNSANSLAYLSYLPCEPGTFQNGTSTRCGDCAIGTHSQQPGQTSCLQCQPGSYSNSTLTSICPTCGAGFYQPVAGKSFCLGCEPGRFNIAENQITCANCLAGSYTNVTGRTSCEGCAPGSSQVETGKSFCVACVAGEFSSAAGQATCLPCPGGVSDPGSASCRLCPTGSFANKTDCVVCASGIVEQGGLSCSPCLPGSYWSSNRTSCVSCESGRFSAGTGWTACQTCMSGWVQPATQQSSCSICLTSQYAMDATQPCEPCPMFAHGKANSWNATGNSVCECDPFFYAVTKTMIRNLPTSANGALRRTLTDALSTSNEEWVCVPCPEGANCDAPGSNISLITPKKNWAADVEQSNFLFFQCLSSEVCEANGCAEGYTGLLCVNCAEGYGKRSSFLCSACPDYGLSVFEIIGLNLLLILMLMLVVQRLRRTSLALADKHMVAVKIMFTGLQVNSFVLNMRIDLSSFVRGFLTFQAGLSQIGVTFLSSECVAKSYPRPVYQVALVYLFSPLLAFAGSVLISSIVVMCQRSCHPIENPKKLVKEYTIISMILVMLLLHPNMARHAFEIFRCTPLSALTQDEFLVADPTIQCYTAEHGLWVGLVAVPLILLVFGIPLAILLYLFRNRALLATDEFMLKWSFIYKGYQPHLWFWEMLIATRKVLLVGIAIFFQGQLRVQAIFSMLLCVTALGLHLWFHPFPSMLLHRLELVSICTSCLLYLLVQFLPPLATDLSEAANQAAEVLIFLSQIGFIVFGAAIIIMGVLKKVRKKHTLMMASLTASAATTSLHATDSQETTDARQKPVEVEMEVGPERQEP